MKNINIFICLISLFSLASCKPEDENKIHELGAEHFHVEIYKDGNAKRLDIFYMPDLDIIDFEIRLNLVSWSEEVFYTTSIKRNNLTKYVDYEINASIASDDFNNSTRVEYTIKATTNTNPHKNVSYRVFLNKNKNERNNYVEVGVGAKLTKHAAPNNTYIDSSHFVGWSTNYESYQAYDFNQEIRTFKFLYAHYDLDYQSFINKVALDVVPANFQVIASSESSSICKSGFVYKNEETHSFLLSTYFPGDDLNFVLSDYLNNIYTPEDNEVELLYNSEANDISIIKYKNRRDQVFQALSLSELDLNVNEEIALVGNDLYQRNIVTLGKVMSLGGTLFQHDAPIYASNYVHIVINYEGEVSGLNFNLDNEVGKAYTSSYILNVLDEVTLP